MARRNPRLRFLGGCWVFPGGAIDASDAAPGAEPIPAAAVADCRELREEAGLELHPGRLVHWSRWITPSVGGRRFDTQFFIAAAPRDQEPRVVEGEVTELHWLPVARWPELSGTGPFRVSPPTRIVLREVAEAFAQHGSVEALLQRERGRLIRSFLPKISGDNRIALPWDPDYDALPGEGVRSDADGIDARRNWSARL